MTLKPAAAEPGMKNGHSGLNFSLDLLLALFLS